MTTQLVLNVVVAASSYATFAAGFLLIYTVGRVFYFSHGALFTAGAYFTYTISVRCGLPAVPSAVMGVLGASLLGCATEYFIHRPLRRRSASPPTHLLCSLGTYIVIQNLISVVYGDDIMGMRSAEVQHGLTVLGGRITEIQLTSVCVSLLVLLTVALLLRKTRFGRAMRAVANDAELAKVAGVESGRVILYTFALGTALAALAGTLSAFDVDMTPTMGMRPLMMGIVVVVIGGRASILGVVLGALLLGFAQHVGVWRIGSQWQDAIAFVILLVFLLFRPQGFFGKKVRTATV